MDFAMDLSAQGDRFATDFMVDFLSFVSQGKRYMF